jgi:hypothetical protein
VCCPAAGSSGWSDTYRSSPLIPEIASEPFEIENLEVLCHRKSLIDNNISDVDRTISFTPMDSAGNFLAADRTGSFLLTMDYSLVQQRNATQRK